MRLARLAPLCVFAALSTGLGLSLRNDPHKLPSTLIDQPAPDFVLPGLDGSGPGLSSRDLDGQVALLNVFASWCGFCRLEHPMLMRIAAGGMPIYGINWKDDPGVGARWLRARKSPYLRVGEDASGRVGVDLGVSGVPETFVIDRTGRIRYRHTGPITDEVWRQTFEPLLAELRTHR